MSNAIAGNMKQLLQHSKNIPSNKNDFDETHTTPLKFMINFVACCLHSTKIGSENIETALPRPAFITGRYDFAKCDVYI